jgi:AcrR family transcriptional regulator
MGRVRELKSRLRAVPAPEANRRERQRLETRERLFEIALAEFRAVGFAAALIDRIAEKAGVSRGTFYFHFPTKDHVLLELQQRGEREIMARIEAMGPRPDDVRVYLERLYRLISESMEADAAVRREVMAMYVRRSHARRALASEPLMVDLVDYLADAAERGAVRSDIPCEALAANFFANLFSHFLAESNPRKRDEDVQLTIEIFLTGISPRPCD